jgi:uncharacterized protein
MASNPISSCPFVAGSMITDPRYFVGCKEALDFLSSKMTAAQLTSINVVGKLKMGKSSLLYHFCQTYEQRVQRYGRQPKDYAVIYHLSMQKNRYRDEERFYTAISQEFKASGCAGQCEFSKYHK